ncbi:Nucleoside-diphosphate-sugar epimerase [Faunimonas pinastri]|uniref:Nucleoside-diphosphate-sugar epimerase n=1 Tax=Faunimonas pinastri TaxID=1855383 RepID=A0A1H9HR25_9HYPH|nr:SDR family oxidoreductase [Faunimonas pinastri]SEQ64799.1 Nucleoside-diphosphate-sugar epimerase [Faunimonas pinastri]
MRVFVTGGSGFLGSAVIGELLQGGHQVLALARSEAATQRLAALGTLVLHGDMENHEALRTGVGRCDAVVHLAFNNDYTKFEETCAIDERAIDAIGKALAHTAKPFVVPNGLAGLAPGRIVTEDDDIPADYAFPRRSEQTALKLAGDGVNAMVVRLAQVHSNVMQGLVSGLIPIARHSGMSAYVDDGANRWPAVHVSDAAHLVRLALERPERGAKFHAVAEEGVEMRVIAEAVGRLANVPMRSLRADEAKAHFGPLGMFVAQDMPASSALTRNRMQWQPTGSRLVHDLDQSRI